MFTLCMSNEILSNPSSIEDLRIKFLCILYLKSENKKLVGMTPQEIFDYIQIHRDPNTQNPPDDYTKVKEKLVETNIKEKTIEFKNGICYLTDYGKDWAKINCHRTGYSSLLE